MGSGLNFNPTDQLLLIVDAWTRRSEDGVSVWQFKWSEKRLEVDGCPL